MRKIRVGVMGTHRGSSMINYCAIADNAEVVAICDKRAEGLAVQRELHKDLPITYYNNFEDFIEHDMDAVVLANYAHEHAPFAIAAMKAGKHVFSEVVPAQTLKEAVELIEAVEQTGKVYAYGENYCYMGGPYEMKNLYGKNTIGDLEYAEGEYIHNMETTWPSVTYGEPDHWRNRMYSTFYCTHSIGPIVHATGLRPVRVTGFESTKNERRLRGGARCAQFAMEVMELSNGAIVKSVHGSLYKYSNWYCMYGSKGRMETARRDARTGDVSRIYVHMDEYEGQYRGSDPMTYVPERPQDTLGKEFSHSGSDFYSMWHFIEKLRGNPEADTIDVYEAMDMFLPGLFAYRSILAGGVPMDIPDLRNKAEREKWRNDVACTDPDKAGDQLLPTCKLGTPDIPMEVYEAVKKQWEEESGLENECAKDIFSQGKIAQGAKK
ncbi:MAG: Gfo/Idh/MocA family oxidoreductase [Oscillospiraceae bacterium]|nr:Gfo/Idh/MocA family oxidoreductase [Oscillospiraceae bacterium]